MKLDFRQRLLATTLLVGASMVASPAFAQDVAPAAPCDPGSPNCVPETTGPIEGTTITTATPSAEGEAIEGTQDIIITGTRIPQPNLTSASPITVVTSQEVKLQGTTRTEDLINSLPQSFAGQGSNISNGATGTATVNLRGLGSSRTLVLVNGRRLHPGDPRAPAPDLNFIPAALVKRVDVLTGGASSVYGADAVAGVVNFIIDTEFRGLRIDGQASVFMHDNDTNSSITEANDARGFLYPTGRSVNGGAQDISVSLGAGFDDNRGHVMAYATYRNQSPVLQSTRDYSFCALTGLFENHPDERLRANGSPRVVDVANSGRNFNCSGSATSAPGSFFTNVGRFQVIGDQFVPGDTPFNFNPYNYFQRPNERYTLGAFAEYEISDMAKPYLEAMFMDDHTDAVIAPSGNFFATNTINCDNPLLSAQQFNLICQEANLVGFVGEDDPDTPEDDRSPPTVFTDPLGNTFNRAIVYTARRNVEGGGRQDDLEHLSFRLVMGLRGDLDRGLSYNASGVFGKTVLSQIYRNDFSIIRLGRAQDVVTDPATGLPVCRSVLTGEDPNCVPYNIFRTGGVTPEALDYLQTPGLSRGNVQQKSAGIDFTFLGGEYGLQLPWSDRGVSANVGGQYIKHSLLFETDTAFSTGDLAGQGGPTIGVSGDYDVRELFGEVEVPIISNSFIEEFTVRAGYRKSWYHVEDNRFSTNTYKLEAELAPIRDVRLRGSYNRAVRAPNVIELFSAQSIGLGGTVDPCAGETPSASLAQCQLTGVTAAQYGDIVSNPANQYNSLFGGNPDLEPEKADSYTFGLVLQPRFVPGLAFTLDYFNIKLENAIGVIGFDTIIQQCITTGDPFFCSRINRNPANGSLFIGFEGFITDINTNTGGLQTKGFDLQGSYARQIGRMGNLNASFVGTLLQDLDVNPTGDIVYDCASYFGAQCGTPNPKWRHKFRLGFTLPNGIGLSGQWRYFSSVKNDALSEDEDLDGDPIRIEFPARSGNFFESTRPGNNKLNAQSYFDLALQARITDRYNFRIGANNIFDKEPPVAGQEVGSGGFTNGNTYPQVYDALGRYLFAGFTVDF